MSDKVLALRIMGVMLNAGWIDYKLLLMIVIDINNLTLLFYYAGVGRFAGIELALLNLSCNDITIGLITIVLVRTN